MKMADEMRKQRYDSLRPVIDIERYRPLSGENVRLEAKEAYAARSGELPDDLGCLLRNIGVGPAIDALSFIHDEERLPYSFGTIAVNATNPYPIKLSLEEKDNRKVLIAYYRDVYGRCFGSIREVSVDEGRGAWKVGPLEIHELPKEECPK